MIGALAKLWAGRVPLPESLLTWGLQRGLLLNVGCTAISFAIWQRADSGPATAIALAIHFLPVPYNIVFAVGAWRAAGDPRYAPRVRQGARALAVGLAALYMVI